MNRKEVKLKAKSDIRGRVAICFVPFLIVGAINAMILMSIASSAIAASQYIKISGMLTPIYTVNIIYEIIKTILILPLNIGLAKVYINIVDDRNNDIGIKEFVEPIKSFKRILNVIITDTIVSLHIIVGFICLILPGIILALRYTVLQFVLAQYPDITWKEAMAKCKEITKGKIWEIFKYLISFTGWLLLSVCTIGILLIYVLPYIQATIANMYNLYNQKSISENSDLDNKEVNTIN